VGVRGGVKTEEGRQRRAELGLPISKKGGDRKWGYVYVLPVLLSVSGLEQWIRGKDRRASWYRWDGTSVRVSFDLRDKPRGPW
jgi:hypothetical protein